jgi:uncharacterized protein YigE (DUF2233 family)
VRHWLVALGFALTACAPASEPTANAACHTIEFESADFTDCVANPAHDTVRLVIDPELRTLEALANTHGDHAKVRFAMNGGMYDEDGRAIGLAVIGGRQAHAINRKHGAGNFHLLPNGIFWAEANGWHVRTSDAYAAAARQPILATQSGPMLVIDGKLHPKFAADGDSRYIRNAVGIDRRGKAHFVISEEPISFGLIARLFRDRLDCPNALFLDGSVSALWDPAAERIDSTVALGPLLVVEAK